VEVGGVSRQPRGNAFLDDFAFWQADLGEAGAAARVVAEFRPELIVHTAALTDVDACEREPERAERANVQVSRLVAQAAAEHGARLVHVSTDYVFNGLAAPYCEADVPNPINVYGQTKLAGERAVLEVAPGAVVARTAMLYGQAPNARPNFVTALLARLESGRGWEVVTDQAAAPTLADNLAAMLWALGRDTEARGIYHTVGATILDRFSFARLLAARFSFDPALIRPIESAAIKQAARRPPNCGLLVEQFRARYPEVAVLKASEALDELRRQLEAGGRSFNRPR
jgi:dTDP-4-dehydrorhamnose reductase